MSNIVNKIKDAIHSDSHSSTTHSGTHSGTHSSAEGTHGPHNSRVANAADPRVDSDRDGSNTMGGTGRTAGHGEMGSSNPFTSSGTHNTNTLGSSGTHNTFGSSGTAEGTHGPHSSRLANAADPRVDSDRDGSNTMGGRTTGTTGTHGIGGTTGGLGGSTFGTGSHNTGASTFGTGSHSAGSGMTGMTGTHGDPAGTHGPHSSRMANAADPRVDSDRDGRGAIGTGPGPAPNTAGPHKSDMLNKADPRIDSDLDGSKTMGGNKTYQSSSMSGQGYRDPTDAAQAPPSVLQQHLGNPSVEHGDHTHQRARRNSVKTDQETFRGL